MSCRERHRHVESSHPQSMLLLGWSAATAAMNRMGKAGAGGNAMKHLQARFTKFCKKAYSLNSILGTIEAKF